MLDAALASRLRLIGFDVDGVLTDGGIYIGKVADHQVEYKRFNIQDGLGIKLLRMAGLVIVFASARRSDSTDLRARELKVDEVVQDNHKFSAFAGVLERRGITWEESAFVGDDLPDLAVLRRVGLPVAVANAVPEVRAVATHVTTAPGGHGAVREIAEAILKARGSWDGLVRQFLEERGDVAQRSAGSR